MNYRSLARRTAVFFVGHLVVLGAILMFAGSVSRAGAPLDRTFSVNATSR